MATLAILALVGLTPACSSEEYYDVSTRPSEYPRWATGATGELNTEEPDETSKDDGFEAGFKPPAQWHNWLWRGNYDWIVHFGEGVQWELGADHIANASDAAIPRMLIPAYSLGSPSSVERTCVMESMGDSNALRLYRTSTSSFEFFEWAYNAEWTGTAWQSDDTGQDSFVHQCQGQQCRVLRRAAGAGTWVDAAWVVQYDLQVSGTNNKLIISGVELTNADLVHGTRTKVIGAADAIGTTNATYNLTSDQWEISGGSASVVFPIVMEKNQRIKVIRVYLSNPTGTVTDLTATLRSDIAAPGAAAGTSVSTVVSGNMPTTATTIQELTLNPTDAALAANETLRVVVSGNGAAIQRAYRVEVDYDRVTGS